MTESGPKSVGGGCWAGCLRDRDDKAVKTLSDMVGKDINGAKCIWRKKRSLALRRLEGVPQTGSSKVGRGQYLFR